MTALKHGLFSNVKLSFGSDLVHQPAEGTSDSSGDQTKMPGSEDSDEGTKENCNNNLLNLIVLST